ncbi:MULTISPECIES: CBS domain-containing protein [unclassified Paraburkholderia]|uniref:CBS domain-containing protein n=1 Tax=unclassified Paraburkholderia TaxID=2615204 RepID=UPI00160E7709|nr:MULTISPECIES: CBS domain-containing protein [unclassified Paraburkholderia]MBB5446375.1 IMP dehydrogenase [Paraburkholderia sp. WSM4177]MBB5458621.1 IMP dehydrogenase [Paraburkholderia sp. Cpub6]MBB5487043.1 IMP dehydrogenase [Paraburkholderia sp. WSM4180]
MASVAELLRAKASRTVWSIEASASVCNAISIMAHREVGALIAVHDGRIAGIVTERDYARKIVLMERSSTNTPVRDIMSTAVRYVSPKQTTDECMAIMTEHRIRHLPVISAGQVTGMVSIGDLIKNLISEQEHTIRQLEHYIHGNGFHAAFDGSKAQPAASLRS